MQPKVEIGTCQVRSLNYPSTFTGCYRLPSKNLQLFDGEFHDLLEKFSSEYILSCGEFNIHFNRICPVSNDSKNILDEFRLVQSVELPTHKVVTRLILSWDHKSLKYVLLVSPHRITSG